MEDISVDDLTNAIEEFKIRKGTNDFVVRLIPHFFLLGYELWLLEYMLWDAHFHIFLSLSFLSFVSSKPLPDSVQCPQI